MRALVCAGEASGDALGAAIATRLVGRGWAVAGLAGPRMRAAGVRSLARAEDLGAIGIAEGIAAAPRASRAVAAVVRELVRRRPDALVTVDSPSALLHVARLGKRAGVPTVHVVSPQLWAWRPGRARRVAASVDVLQCLLPFEIGLYRGLGIRAEFVGHPAAVAPERIATSGPTTLALCPGSRGQEVARLWPVFARVALQLRRALPGLRLVAARAPTVDPSDLTGVPGLEVSTLSEAAGRSDLALVASGTATLELAAAGVPMVVAYALSPISWYLLQKVVRVRHVALPNLVAGARIVPEHVQELHTDTMVRDLRALIGPAGDEQRAQLAHVTAALAGPGAVDRMVMGVQRAAGGPR